MDFLDFVQRIKVYGLSFLKVFYGPQRGLVTACQDPEKRGRIQAIVPGVGQREAPDVWIDPMLPFTGANYGSFHAPEVGTPVWVEFENGDPSRPIRYSGGWFAEKAVPAELAPNASNQPYRRGTVTRAGHVLSFNDEPGKERIQLVWHKPSDESHLATPNTAADRESGNLAYLSFEPSGDVQISNSKGTMVILDANNAQLMLADEGGSMLTLDKDGIKLLDSKGQFLGLDGGEFKVITAGNMTLFGSVLNVKAGGVLLGDGAVFSAPVGEILLQYLVSLTTWLQTLTLPVSGPTAGPPPVPPPLPTEQILSTKVKLAP